MPQLLSSQPAAGSANTEQILWNILQMQLGNTTQQLGYQPPLSAPNTERIAWDIQQNMAIRQANVVIEGPLTAQMLSDGIEIIPFLGENIAVRLLFGSTMPFGGTEDYAIDYSLAPIIIGSKKGLNNYTFDVLFENTVNIIIVPVFDEQNLPWAFPSFTTQVDAPDYKDFIIINEPVVLKCNQIDIISGDRNILVNVLYQIIDLNPYIDEN